MRAHTHKCAHTPQTYTTNYILKNSKDYYSVNFLMFEIKKN